MPKESAPPVKTRSPLVRALLPNAGGIVILGGFLEADANRVYAAYYRQGFRLLRSYHIKGWRTLVLQR